MAQPPAPYVPGEVVVRLAASPPPDGADPSAPKSASPADLQRGRAPVPAVFAPLVGRVTGALLAARPVAPGGMGRAVRAQGAAPVEAAPETTLYVLRFAGTEDTDALCRAVRDLPGVVRAEPNYLGTLSYAPTDPYYTGNQKPLLDRLGMEAAWDVQQGGEAFVVVAVIDSGIDATHEDLEHVIHPASANFVDPANGIYDDLGHGTRVAGIIAAEANNGVGIAGIAFGVKVLSLDVVNAAGQVTSASVIAALDHARAEGAQVINLSLSIFGRSTLLEQACDAAAQTAVLVASAGNEGRGDRPVYPASYDSVLGVGATERLSDLRASYSNYNGTDTSLVDLVAPGSNVFTTIPGSVYDGLFTSGTSFAAPVVSGLAALLRSRYPEQSPAGIVYQLQATAVPLGAWAGSGRVDAEAALETALLPGLSIASIVVDDATTLYAGNDVDGAWDKEETVDLILTLANAAGDAVNVSGTLATTDPAVTVVDGVGGWGDIASGVAKAATKAVRVSAAAGATAHEATLSLSLASNGGAYTVVLAPRPRIENEQLISGVKLNQTFTSDKTYRVTGNLLLRGNTTIHPGTVFKVHPGVDVQASVGCALTAVGTADAPILFTSAQPTALGPDESVIGPRTEVVNWAGYQQVRYVSANTGSDETGDGSSTSPWRSIRHALAVVAGDASAGNRYALLVAEGTYEEGATIYTEDNVDLYGGFGSDGWERDIFEYASVILASPQRQAITVRLNHDVRIDGFAVTNGQTGILCFSGSAQIISNNILFGNKRGIYVEAGTKTLRNNAMFANRIVSSDSANYGAGVYVAQGTHHFLSNLICGNTVESGSWNNGGGIYIGGGSAPVLSGNLIAGNRAQQDGGGIYIAANSGLTKVYSSVLASNSASSGGAVFVTSTGGSSIAATNTQFSNCGTAGSNITLNHCNYYFGSGWSGPGSNNISADPRMVGLATWGTILESQYDTCRCTSTVSISGSALTGDCLKGRMIRIGERGYYLVRANTSDTITVFGDMTQGGTVGPPLRWVFEDYHLRSDSPNRGAGIGPGVDPSVPVEDMDGEARSGSTCDIGIDEYNLATGPAVPFWGQLWLTDLATGATLEQVIVENGLGALTNLANSSVTACLFRNNLGRGLASTVGTAAVHGCTASGNYGHGIDASTRPLTDCTARNNAQGLVGSALSKCSAHENVGDGLTGTSATDCIAERNAGRGAVLTGNALRVTAQNNLSTGIRTTGGHVTECRAFRNDGIGIYISGGGTASGSTSDQNQAGGIETGGSTVSNCLVQDNAAFGVKGSGGASLSSSRIAGNAGAAVSGVQTVTDCAITECASGVAGANTITGTYVAANTGDGITGGAITGCSVLGSAGSGVKTPVSLSNSWVIRNAGDGVFSNNGVGPVDTCTIAGNDGIAVRNIASLVSCNIFDNGGYAALDDVVSGIGDRDFENNYWGPVDTLELVEKSVWSNLTFLQDVLDGSGNWLLDVWPYETLPVADAPSAAAPAVLLEVTPNLDNAVNVGLAAFTLVFSEAMDTGVQPTVTFDTDAPYTAHVVSPNPGWTDATTWEGVYAVDTVVGSGRNTIRVSGAKAADGFTIPDDTFHRFDIDVDAQPGVANGRIVDTYPNGLRIAWDPSPTAVKFELYRVEGPDQGDPNQEPLAYGKPFHTVWAPSTEYTNLGLSGGTLYFYQVKETDASGNTSDLDNPFHGYTGGSVVYVDDDGPYNGVNRFNTMADGVAAVPSGGTVVVYEGTYAEQVTVTKPLTLMGSGSAILDGGGAGTGILVSSTGVTIAYLRIQNYEVGIRVGASSHATIHHCSFVNNTVYAVENQNTSLEVKAENCWWGKAGGP